MMSKPIINEGTQSGCYEFVDMQFFYFSDIRFLV